MDKKVKLEVIEKLMRSSSEEDIAIGLSLLYKRYNGNKAWMTRTIRKIYKGVKKRTLDLYTDDQNYFINSDGDVYIYPPTYNPREKGKEIRI